MFPFRVADKSQKFPGIQIMNLGIMTIKGGLYRIKFDTKPDDSLNIIQVLVEDITHDPLESRLTHIKMQNLVKENSRL